MSWLWNKIKSLFSKFLRLFELIPTIVFWQNYIKKLLSFTVSLKIYMLSITTYLLLIGKISDTVWSTVFLGIALGRIVEKKIYSDKHVEEDSDMPNTIPDAIGE